MTNDAADAGAEELYEMQREIRHVLWHLGDRVAGWEPGSFTSKLLSAWDSADHWNSAALAAAFPMLGRAVGVARSGGRRELLETLERVKLQLELARG